VDFSHGHTGSAHDSNTFESTAAFRHSNWLFKGEEFAWADSAYGVSDTCIPIHKRPAADHPDNARFDRAVAHICIRCEHCMGALKGRWQCLRGLRVSINSKRDHIEACRWITVAIILHNLCIDVEGNMHQLYLYDDSYISVGRTNLEHFMHEHDMAEEQDATPEGEDLDNSDEAGKKR
jgi:hypothetical protein